MRKRRITSAELRALGHRLLGPPVNLYLAKLHAHLSQTDPAADRILFAMRAGLRLKSLYENWLRRRGAAVPKHAHLFRSSRLMAIKAASGVDPAAAMTVLGSELDGESLDTIVRAVLRAEHPASAGSAIPCVPSQPLHEFLKSDTPVAERMRRHLRQQARIFGDYVETIAGSADRLILVDTGWRGTQQLLLEQTFTDRVWHGLYFGCIGRAEILGRRAAAMTGLIFDNPYPGPGDPSSIFAGHRHLIESLFEPNLPSVERVDNADIKTVRDGMHNRISEGRLADPVYDGVAEYIRDHACDGLSDISDAFEKSLTKLSRMIAFPDRSSASLLAHKPRSLDLGRAGSVAVLLPAKNRHPGDSAAQRVADALWPAGQAALEFSGTRLERAQKCLLHGKGAPTVKDREPSVAIVTRTKDRPLLLARAARSVASQSYRNYHWIVVNDGGDPDPVREILGHAAIDPARIRFCSFEESQGMEAASNAGIRASRSDLIVIHDDDDSWECDFLADAVAFLSEHEDLYAGVVTHSTYIAEEIGDGRVREQERRPFNGWLASIQLAEMAVANLFPPIAFLFRRTLWEKLGGYDESLPVLGDWDFNLRFLMEADIGVLAKPLANYHHRSDTTAGDSYANSDIAARNPHIAFNAVIRNRYLRAAENNPKYRTLATLMGQAYAHEDTRARIDRMAGVPEAATPRSGEAAARGTDLKDLRRELNHRWTLLHMVVSELIASRGLQIGVEEMIRQLSGLADEYARTTDIRCPDNAGTRGSTRIRKAWPATVGKDRGAWTARPGAQHFAAPRGAHRQ
ncbi:glycosyltransferase [Nisaea sp.]|uniref:glycosyltransferase n=1 Tax=Nisaea sp. TaxID=2024842 RepID=UPI003B51DF4C